VLLLLRVCHALLPLGVQMQAGTRWCARTTDPCPASPSPGLLRRYTPEHMHCMATVYGPLAPQNTGVVAIQHTGSDVKGWRVSATGEETPT
jgi:hypothetical protein